MLSRTGSWIGSVGNGPTGTVTPTQLAAAGLAAGDLCFMAATVVAAVSEETVPGAYPTFPAGWRTVVGPQYDADASSQYYNSVIVCKVLTSGDISSGVIITILNGATVSGIEVSFMGYTSDGAPGTVPIYIDSIVPGLGVGGAAADVAITPAAINEWLVGLAILSVEPSEDYATNLTVTGTVPLPYVTYTEDNLTCIMFDSNGTVAKSLMSEVFSNEASENLYVALVAIADKLPVKSGFFDFF
jgi:hypothetical protein